MISWTFAAEGCPRSRPSKYRDFWYSTPSPCKKRGMVFFFHPLVCMGWFFNLSSPFSRAVFQKASNFSSGKISFKCIKVSQFCKHLVRQEAWCCFNILFQGLWVLTWHPDVNGVWYVQARTKGYHLISMNAARVDTMRTSFCNLMQLFMLCPIKYCIFSQHLNGAATDLAMAPEAKQGRGQCTLLSGFFKALLGPLQFFFKLPAPHSFCHMKILFQSICCDPFFKGFSWDKSIRFLLGQNKTAQHHAESGATSSHTPSPPTSCLHLFFGLAAMLLQGRLLLPFKNFAANYMYSFAVWQPFSRCIPNFWDHAFFKAITWPWKSLPCSRPSC